MLNVQYIQMEPNPVFCATTGIGTVIDAYFVRDHNTILLFNRNGKLSWVRFRPKPKQFSRVISNTPISAVAFSDSCATVIVGDESGSFHAISKDGQILSKDHHKQSKRITKLEFSHSCELFASVSEDGSVKLFNTRTYEMMASFYDHPGLILDLTFSLDGTSFITACSDKKIRVFSLAQKQMTRVLGPFPLAPTSLISNNPRQFFAGFMNGIVARCDTQSGSLLFCQKPHATSVTCMCLHSSKRFLLTTSADNNLSLIDLTEPGNITTVKAHKKPVRVLRFSPSGMYFLTVDNHGTVIVWSLLGNDACIENVIENIQDTACSSEEVMKNGKGLIETLVLEEGHEQNESWVDEVVRRNSENDIGQKVVPQESEHSTDDSSESGDGFAKGKGFRELEEIDYRTPEIETLMGEEEEIETESSDEANLNHEQNRILETQSLDEIEGDAKPVPGDIEVMLKPESASPRGEEESQSSSFDDSQKPESGSLNLNLSSDSDDAECPKNSSQSGKQEDYGMLLGHVQTESSTDDAESFESQLLCMKNESLDETKNTQGTCSQIDDSLQFLKDREFEWSDLKKQYPILASLMEEDEDEPEVTDSELTQLLARVLSESYEEETLE